MIDYVSQTKVDLPRGWKSPGWDDSDYVTPQLEALTGDESPICDVIGTVRNERLPFLRSWAVWAKQQTSFNVRFWVLDDGSEDRAEDAVKALIMRGAPLRYVKYRTIDDTTERCCTLVFNSAIRKLCTAPLVGIQWWDRIPGSFELLDALILPHLERTDIVTSGVSRHVGGSSSVEHLTADQLKAQLGKVHWREDPESLNQIAGAIGGHCTPGVATESSCFVVRKEYLEAIGGYDERYVTRASYANVELWARLVEGARVEALTVPEPIGSNFHQSHPCPTNREKPGGYIRDDRIVRNQNLDWGDIEPLEVV